MRLRYLLPAILANKLIHMTSFVRRIVLIGVCITSALFIFSLTLPVSAIDLGLDRVATSATRAGFAEATNTTFATNVGRFVSLILSVLGVIFTVLIVYAGFLWMTAAGEDTKVEKAKNIISSSIIGLIIILMAYSITNFVVPRIMQDSITTTTTAP